MLGPRIHSKSSLVCGFWLSCFFSALLPACTTLHSLHGCLPSKVLLHASRMEVVLRLEASMPIQAADCSTVQCAPTATISSETMSHLGYRAVTQADASAKDVPASILGP